MEEFAQEARMLEWAGLVALDEFGADLDRLVGDGENYY